LIIKNAKHGFGVHTANLRASKDVHLREREAA